MPNYYSLMDVLELYADFTDNSFAKFFRAIGDEILEDYALDLEVPDAELAKKYDIVLNQFVWKNIAAPSSFICIAEPAEVMKKGGRAILAIYNELVHWGRYYAPLIDANAAITGDATEQLTSTAETSFNDVPNSSVDYTTDKQYVSTYTKNKQTIDVDPLNRAITKHDYIEDLYGQWLNKLNHFIGEAI